MKKTFIFILSLTMSVMVQAQLLYRISGNGLQKESYILGTEHVIGGSFLFQIPGAFQAFNSVELVCGELSQKEMAKQSPKMFLPDGKTLKDIMTEDEFNRLDECFLKLMGGKLSNETVYSQMGNMNPIALTSLFSVKFASWIDSKFISFENNIDDYIQKMAIQRGKGAIGLETMEYQMDVLMCDPIEKQVESLMCMVDNFDTYKELNINLTNAYLSQDIEKLTTALFAKMGNKCDPTLEEEDRLIFNRNRNWAEQMPEIMSARSTFFAVGVGHLCGEKSVLAYLKKKGYTVEAVK